MNLKELNIHGTKNNISKQFRNRLFTVAICIRQKEDIVDRHANEGILYITLHYTVHNLCIHTRIDFF